MWAEIPDDGITDREATLELVASGLFSGYTVKAVPSQNCPVIVFSADEPVLRPRVNIIFPSLRGEAAEWFSRDISPLPEMAASLASSIPPRALEWASDTLRAILSNAVSRILPGWLFTQQVYISGSDAVINLSFRPSENMILAITPAITSRTIPVMFRSDLQASLIPAMSSLIGLPVEWAMLHKSDIERLARNFLEERNTVGNMRASVTVSFSPGRISEINARVDSRSFMFSVWVSAYAGLEGRYPEAGTFFGFRPVWRIGEINLAPELYGEMIFSLDNFGLSYRAGLRLETLENLWAGLEYDISGGASFLRMDYIPLKERRPYARWRWELGRSWHEFALGYRFGGHISAEIIYFSSGGKIGLRGIWNL